MWLESMNRMVARCQLLKRRQATGRHGLRQPFDGQAAQRSARRRVDGEDLRGEAAIADGTRHEAGRMTAADLDDAPWTIPAHDGIGIAASRDAETNPGPSARPAPAGGHRTQRVRMFIERPQLSGELRCIDFEQLLDLLIGQSAPGRGEAMGIAIGMKNPLPAARAASTNPATAVARCCGPASFRTGRRPPPPSWTQDHALAGNQRAWPHLLGGGGDFVHDRIIVGWGS
jgi:hypothetical protein